MINFEGAQVVWNRSENRPANGDELANLINKGWLLMNFVCRANDGKVWIDLADKAEDDYEIRRGLTMRGTDGACACGHSWEAHKEMGCVGNDWDCPCKQPRRTR